MAGVPRYYNTLGGDSSAGTRQPTLQRRSQSEEDVSTPICRCRVLYLGSAVPQVTKDGLQGIQEPLRELYPDAGAMGAKGIDSWLSVWSNGLLLENVDENHQRVTRFFPIESLHYCAAVRYVLVPSTSPTMTTVAAAAPGPGPGVAASGERLARFLPLDSPFARHPNIHHPPLFACIMRRTSGIKVLECHVFICKRETAANALVRCCFHAYADSTYARHLEEEEKQAAVAVVGKSSQSIPVASSTLNRTGGRSVNGIESPDATLNSIEKVETWKLYQQQQQKEAPTNGKDEGGSTSSHGMGSASVSMLILDHGSAEEEDSASSIVNGDENHKVWLPSSTEQAAVPRRLAATGPVAPVADMYGGGGSGGGATNTMRSVKSGMMSTSTLPGRRPRQILAPYAAPPPPPPLLLANDETDSKVKKSKKKQQQQKSSAGNRSSDMDDLSSVMTGPAQSVVSRRPSASVFNMPVRPLPPPGAYPINFPFRPGTMPPPPPPGAYLVPMPIPVAPGTLKKSKKFGTFSARGGPLGKKSSKSHKNMVFVPPPPPPVLAPPPMALGMPVPMMAPPLSMRRGSVVTSMEEPIYMPSQVRPLSPIASYAPAHFPHEAYLMQQHYTTLVQPVKVPQPTTLTKLKKKDKAKKNKHNNNNNNNNNNIMEDQIVDGMSLHADQVSLASAGIYRKGHLNERAFSYSIRQEHRSRSYSSLAGLGAAAYMAGPEDLRAHDKKERELIQMVHDLELSGDDLERSEVPLAMYPHHHRQQPR